MLALLDLPWNILMNILKHLSSNDIRNLMVTCRSFMEFVIHENALWRHLNRDKMVILGSANNRVINKPLVYHQCRVSHNWMSGYFKQKESINQRINFMPWIEYPSSEFLILSFGSKLWCYPMYLNGYPNCARALWKLTVPTEDRHDKRTDDISRFIIKHNHLVCGNRDGCAILYKIHRLRQTPRLVRHIKNCHNDGREEVSAVELVGAEGNLKIVTVSQYSTQVSFWDGGGTSVSNQWDEATRTVTIPDCLGIRGVATHTNEGLLAMSPDGNCKPLLLDITTGEVIWRAEGTRNDRESVRDIVWHDHNNIACVSHAGYLRVTDARTGRTVYSATDPFQASLYCVKTDGDRALVVGASQHSRCVLYDLRHSRKHVQLYFTQRKSSPVYCLDFDSRRLIAAADRSVTTLNFDVYPRDVHQHDYSDDFVR